MDVEDFSQLIDDRSKQEMRLPYDPGAKESLQALSYGAILLLVDSSREQVYLVKSHVVVYGTCGPG